MKLRRENLYFKTQIKPQTTHKTTISSVEIFTSILTLNFPNVCKVRINTFFLLKIVCSLHGLNSFQVQNFTHASLSFWTSIIRTTMYWWRTPDGRLQTYRRRERSRRPGKHTFMLNDKGMIQNQNVTNIILNFQSSLLGCVTIYITYRQVDKFHTFHLERLVALRG